MKKSSLIFCLVIFLAIIVSCSNKSPNSDFYENTQSDSKIPAGTDNNITVQNTQDSIETATPAPQTTLNKSYVEELSNTPNPTILDSEPRDLSPKPTNKAFFEYNGLVELENYDSDFVIDLKYATTDNFTLRQHYETSLCLVNKDIASPLVKANNLAKKDGYRIKIYDAYRPISVQQALYDATPENLKQYVPKPSKYSMHARGITVDVTLVDSEGNELDMPTPFDDFTEKAHSDYSNLTKTQINNRSYLKSIMEECGFTVSKLEWWHFDGPNRDNYPILDISFTEFILARDSN